MRPVPLALLRGARAPVACCRPAAVYAASLRCASSAVPAAASASSTSTSSSSAPPSTTQPPTRDLSKAATARVRHPRSIFNEALSAKRKQYLAEGKAIQQQKALAAAAEQKRREAKDRELEAKIRLFKAERARSFSDDDALGGSYPFASPSSSSAVDALTGGANKQKEAAADVDPVFKTRATMWRKYNAARRQQRFENNVAEREAQSEIRLESLLYLYHSARTFVTYDNVDAQVRALQPPLTSTFKFGGEEQNARVFGAARRRALKDTLEGTLNDGRFGVHTLKSHSANQAVNEADEAANQKFFEERKRHLDNSRIAPGTGTNA
ncbi:hypothetical protein HDU87_008218 [Geranomyces variabilis]|uniref:Uncharacterized protein n=1 Tax=Geranomyces variabilis TaxID=109894 RepID=A0AAD5TFL3_9FUNG|nr:hypothetical protein HDU87_008218 [Geranomyces variabilis]